MHSLQAVVELKQRRKLPRTQLARYPSCAQLLAFKCALHNVQQARYLCKYQCHFGGRYHLLRAMSTCPHDAASAWFAGGKAAAADSDEDDWDVSKAKGGWPLS